MTEARKPLENEKSERRIGDLVECVRQLSREARESRRRREATVVIEADEAGRLTIRFRPDLPLD